MNLALRTRFDRLLACFSVATIALLGVTFPAMRLALRTPQVLRLGGVLVILALVVAFYVHRRSHRLANVVRMLFWSLLLTTLCSLLFYLPVRAGAPLADPLFARLDASLGFATSRAVAWSVARPLLNTILFRVYDSLAVLCLVSVVVPALIDRVDRTHLMLVTILLSVILAVAISFALSGVGPWEAEPFVPTWGQSQCGDVVHLLKGDSGYSIDLEYLDPIISIPSWHVIFAVVSALVWRPFRVAWPLALAWALVIAASTLTTGWHYLIDVIAGAAVAALAYGVSVRWIMPRLEEAPAGAVPRDNPGTIVP